MSVSTVITVTLLVPLTVKTAHVTYRMERVLRVNLGGLIYIVIKVRLLMSVFFHNMS